VIKWICFSMVLGVSLPMAGFAQHSLRALDNFKGIPFGSSSAQVHQQLQALGYEWYETAAGDGVFSHDIVTYDGLFYGVWVTIGTHFYYDSLVSVSVMVDEVDEGRIFRQLLLDHRMPKMNEETTNLLWFYPDGYVNWQPREGFSIVTFFSFKSFSAAQERSMS
jgi:hypothetical protein